MKPLIFEFKEAPIGESIDYSLIEYSPELNLSINKNTGRPAIEALDMETETFTKATGEGSDSDRDDVHMLMDTSTRTFTELESSDSDNDLPKKSFTSLLDTTTLPEGVQPADDDKDWK